MDLSRFLHAAPKSGLKYDLRGASVKRDVFESHFIKVEGCWIWTATKNSNGYGSYGKRLAHRVSYEIYNGDIPDSTCVLHKCDVRECVNPAHLWLGSRKENMQDCKAKGRMSMPPRFVGSAHPESKMDESKVQAVRLDVLGGLAKRAAARKYGIDRSTLRSILERRTWRHV